jgi:hypothetical protein
MSNNKQSTDDIQISLSLQSFISAFIFRLGQFIIDPDQKIVAGTRLSTILKSVFIIPEIKEIIRNIRKDLTKITDDQWLDYFKKYFDAVYDQQLSLYEINETEISDLSVYETDKAVRILQLLGVKESLDIFAKKVRFLIEDLLTEIDSGKLPEFDWIDEIFTKNPDHALLIINVSLGIIDKPNLDDILNKAGYTFSSSFLHSPTVNVTEGIIEKEYEWGQADDASFNKSWHKINKEIIYKVNASDLELPKIKRISDKLNDLNEIVVNKTYFILRE